MKNMKNQLERLRSDISYIQCDCPPPLIIVDALWVELIQYTLELAEIMHSQLSIQKEMDEVNELVN